MKLHYQILVPLLSLFWVRVDLTDLFPLELPVKVVEILDGDTVVVRKGNFTMKVRLSRIDAPEMSQNFHLSRKRAGVFSRDCLAQLIPQEALLRVEGFDVYRRILGDISGVNFLAVKNGCAGLYPHAQFSSVQEKWKYLRALTEAKRARRGVWARGGYMLPKKWRKLSKGSGSRWKRKLSHCQGPCHRGRKSG